MNLHDAEKQFNATRGIMSSMSVGTNPFSAIDSFTDSIRAASDLQGIDHATRRRVQNLVWGANQVSWQGNYQYAAHILGEAIEVLKAPVL